MMDTNCSLKIICFQNWGRAHEAEGVTYKTEEA